MMISCTNQLLAANTYRCEHGSTDSDKPPSIVSYWPSSSDAFRLGDRWVVVKFEASKLTSIDGQQRNGFAPTF
jgi:hypothetical protein